MPIVRQPTPRAAAIPAGDIPSVPTWNQLRRTLDHRCPQPAFRHRLAPGGSLSPAADSDHATRELANPALTAKTPAVAFCATKRFVTGGYTHCGSPPVLPMGGVRLQALDRVTTALTILGVVCPSGKGAPITINEAGMEPIPIFRLGHLRVIDAVDSPYIDRAAGVVMPDKPAQLVACKREEAAGRLGRLRLDDPGVRSPSPVGDTCVGPGGSRKPRTGTE